MQPVFDDVVLRSRVGGSLVLAPLLAVLLLATALSLVGCRYLTPATPAPLPTATAIPRRDPIPTVEVLDSEALYGQDSRSIGQTNPSLASFPAGAILPPAPDGRSERGVSVILDTETTLFGELYAPVGPRQPGILLLGTDLAGWGALPATLSQHGFAVLVVQTEPLTPARQVEAILQSLIAAPGVDAGSIGVIGADRAADIAALGCAVNSLCDVLALLSPRSRDTLVNMMPSYGARPIWLAAGQDDKEASDAASVLAAAAAGEAKYVEVSAGRGVELLGRQPNLVDDLLAWMLRHLQAQ